MADQKVELVVYDLYKVLVRLFTNFVTPSAPLFKRKQYLSYPLYTIFKQPEGGVGIIHSSVLWCSRMKSCLLIAVFIDIGFFFQFLQPMKIGT